MNNRIVDAIGLAKPDGGHRRKDGQHHDLEINNEQ